MASISLEKENDQNQTLLQAIQQKFGTQNDSKSNSANAPALFIPQLRIPQQNVNKHTTPAEQATLDEARRDADARNELLLNAIKRRHQKESGLSLFNGFMIPKLRKATGELLEESQTDIPLLNKLRSQNGLLEVPKIEQQINKLKITADNNAGDGVQQDSIKTPVPAMPLIDLTTAIIAVNKNAQPREAATKARKKRTADHFDIAFIPCDRRSRLSDNLLGRRRRRHSAPDDADSTEMTEEPPTSYFIEEPSLVGQMFDKVLNYPAPRKPQLKYACTPLEMQHLKIYKYENYGSNIKRFRFDTPSPDEEVKAALQKSWRISRT